MFLRLGTNAHSALLRQRVEADLTVEGVKSSTDANGRLYCHKFLSNR